MAHHDHGCCGFLPLHAQPCRYVVGHDAGGGAHDRILGFAGAYGAAASLGRQPNPFSLAADVHPQWFTLLVLLVVIALDEITINVMNLYTGGLSLSNLLEGPGRFWNTLFVGIVSTFLSAFPVLLDRLVPLTTALGNLFAPLAGVLLFHYLFVARMH